MIIKYVNSNQQEINLNTEPYKLLVSDLLDYEWEVVSSDNRIQGFGYSVREKKLDIDVHRTKEYGARANMNVLTDFFERDIMNGTPGRLYIDEQYMNCYIKSSKKSNWETDQIIQCEYGIVSDYPFWIQEHEFNFKAGSIVSTNGKKYPYKYPYRYSGLNNTYIINPHFTDSNFLMRIYGPATNPQINIGGWPYLVNIILEQGEYLEIDSENNTVTKVMMNGERVNAFHNRSKGKYSVFQKIPSGRQNITWSATFSFDLIIYEERSEPKW